MKGQIDEPLEGEDEIEPCKESDEITAEDEIEDVKDYLRYFYFPNKKEQHQIFH